VTIALTQAANQQPAAKARKLPAPLIIHMSTMAAADCSAHASGQERRTSRKTAQRPPAQRTKTSHDLTKMFALPRSATFRTASPA
jgi:hypothetical protein